MRSVLLGSDFVYNSNGDLIPIEINTNVGMENFYLENDNDVFNLTQLSNFIVNNNFIKVIYVGSLRIFNEKLIELCEKLNIQYEYFRVFPGNITIPFIEDSSDYLIIRTAYDTTAIVDDVYCKNKINFLELIKNQPFGSEFAYMNEIGEVINYITTIPDNGVNPNFILKSVLPQYDKNLYPKLYKISNQEELQIILSNLTIDYFLMPYNFNPDKLYDNQIYVIRTFNLLFPPNLNSLYIGSYKKLTDRKNENIPTYSIDTFELDYIYRDQYLTSNKIFHTPKLIDTDRVQMADGTFKTALDLQVGDIVKSLVIYNPYDVDLEDDLAEFNITYDEFVSGSTYSTNKVIAKKRVDRICHFNELFFTDGTDWSDTSASSYLVLKNNEIQFERIENLKSGDQIVLVNTLYSNLITTLKEIASINITKTIFSGWEITVEERHVFLTQTDNDTDNESFAAIEHNVSCTGKTGCAVKTCTGKVSCYSMTAGICSCGDPT